MVDVHAQAEFDLERGEDIFNELAPWFFQQTPGARNVALSKIISLHMILSEEHQGPVGEETTEAKALDFLIRTVRVVRQGLEPIKAEIINSLNDEGEQ